MANEKELLMILLQIRIAVGQLNEALTDIKRAKVELEELIENLERQEHGRN